MYLLEITLLISADSIQAKWSTFTFRRKQVLRISLLQIFETI